MQRSVRSVPVVVLDVLAQDDVEVAWSGDQQVVEAFPAQCPDEAFRRTAPFSPFGAFSYSATIASLYSALNVRRDGRGEGPSADRGPDDGDTSPLPVAAARRSSDDTSTRISDHALCCEPLTSSCLT